MAFHARGKAAIDSNLSPQTPFCVQYIVYTRGIVPKERKGSVGTVVVGQPANPGQLRRCGWTAKGVPFFSRRFCFLLLYRPFIFIPFLGMATFLAFPARVRGPSNGNARQIVGECVDNAMSSLLTFPAILSRTAMRQLKCAFEGAA